MTREEMQKQLLTSIRQYNVRAAAVLAKAMVEGGPDRVAELEAQYDALRTAYFDLVRARLDENNLEFDALLRQTSDASVAIDASLSKLESSAKVLNAIADATNLARRILDVAKV
jgi:hypothetical protein